MGVSFYIVGPGKEIQSRISNELYYIHNIIKSKNHSLEIGCIGQFHWGEKKQKALVLSSMLLSHFFAQFIHFLLIWVGEESSFYLFLFVIHFSH